MYSCISIEAPSLYAANQLATTKKLRVRIDIVVPMCEKPSSMNRWCKCVLSGLNGDFFLNMRIDITRNVSNTGIASTASVKGISPMPCAAYEALNESVLSMLITNIDIIVPITSVPPSPINILVLLPNTLCKKKGIMAPAADTARTVITMLPDK